MGMPPGGAGLMPTMGSPGGMRSIENGRRTNKGHDPGSERLLLPHKVAHASAFLGSEPNS